MGGLVALCGALTLQAGAVFDYLSRTVDGLARSGTYSERVLGEPPVTRPAGGEALR